MTAWAPCGANNDEVKVAGAGGQPQIAGGQAQIAGGQPQIDGGPLTSIIPDMRLFIIINIKLWKYFRNKKPKVYLMKYKK